MEKIIRKIVINKAKCKICGDILESTSRHDFKQCKCKSMAVDGGHDYISRAWDPQYGDKDDIIEEMNEVEELNYE
ncbi:MAG: hypothetical protein K6G85_06360 [Eubacterium sp.]|nr:hypothetical protein [Eubacterium sp.]